MYVTEAVDSYFLLHLEKYLERKQKKYEVNFISPRRKFGINTFHDKHNQIGKQIYHSLSSVSTVL